MEHIFLIEKILRQLNREKISLKLLKCEFAKRDCEWLGHRITETGVTPLKRRTSPIDALAAPKTVTQLKSFMSSIHGSGSTGDLYQRTTSRTLNRYKLLKSNVIAESKHTIKLKNGSVLRKSVVAAKPKKTLPKKRKPATLKDMLASAKKGAIESPKSKRPKAKQPAPIATYRSESSDSEDHQPLKNIPARLPVEISARHEAIAAGQGPRQKKSGGIQNGNGVRTKPTKVKRGKGNQDRPALVVRE